MVSRLANLLNCCFDYHLSEIANKRIVESTVAKKGTTSKILEVFSDLNWIRS